MRNSAVGSALLMLLVACGDTDRDSVGPTVSGLEAVLSTNSEWPYETIGILDIVEAGGYEDSEYPSWAVGFLLESEKDEGIGVSISIGEGVVSRAKINIDSGMKVKVWLEAPTTQWGVDRYPISRIQAQ